MKATNTVPVMAAAAVCMALATAAGPGLAQTIITSLPYTCAAAGETYQLEGDLTSPSGTAITIDADDVVIDGQGFELQFAQSGAGTGIDVNDSAGSTIRNVVFRTAHTGGGGDIVHISLNGQSPTVESCTFHITGQTSADDATYGIRGSLTTSGTVTDCTFDIAGAGRIAAVSLGGAPALVTFNTFLAHDCTQSGSEYKQCVSGLGDDSTLADNVITVESTVPRFYPVGAWDSDGLQVLRNTILYAAEHGRIVCPDNNSEGWLIQDNVITVTSNVPGGNAVYAIRYRGTEAPANCGGDHVIEYNTVDCSAASGSGGCNSISIGDDPGGDNCGGVTIRYNLLTSRDSPALDFYDGPAGNVVDQDIYCNRIESTGSSGYPVAIGDEPLDVKFSYNQLVTARPDGTEVHTSADHGAEVDFCETDPAVLDVAGGGSVTLSAAPCQDGSAGCYADAGARPSGGPLCGDEVCEGEETCASCPSDCGPCPADGSDETEPPPEAVDAPDAVTDAPVDVIPPDTAQDAEEDGEEEGPSSSEGCGCALAL